MILLVSLIKNIEKQAQLLKSNSPETKFIGNLTLQRKINQTQSGASLENIVKFYLDFIEKLFSTYRRKHTLIPVKSLKTSLIFSQFFPSFRKSNSSGRFALI